MTRASVVARLQYVPVVGTQPLCVDAAHDARGVTRPWAGAGRDARRVTRPWAGAGRDARRVTRPWAWGWAERTRPHNFH